MALEYFEPKASLEVLAVTSLFDMKLYWLGRAYSSNGSDWGLLRTHNQPYSLG